jgi:hypothetical protein
MEDSKTLFYSSKFLWASERIFSKRKANLGTSPKKMFPPTPVKTHQFSSYYAFLSSRPRNMFRRMSILKNMCKPSLASVGQGMARKEYSPTQHLQCTGYLFPWPQQPNDFSYWVNEAKIKDVKPTLRLKLNKTRGSKQQAFRPYVCQCPI